MFIPRHFAVHDSDEIDNFIAHHDFGTLVSQVDGSPFATHLPFHRPAKDRMQAHLAKANPQWHCIDGQQVLIILTGSHGYISPTWYKNPGVPTWNYQVVHITGIARCFRDKDRLLELVQALSTTHEQQRNPAWDGEFDQQMLNAIVGVDIEIESIQCKYKLSQNRPVEDRLQVIDRLAHGDNPELAEQMRRALES